MSRNTKGGSTPAVTEGDGFVARRSTRVTGEDLQADGDTWRETLAVCELRGKLTIRSYFSNSRTHKRQWDEPPSGASKIIHATETMRRMANLQLQEMQIATGVVKDTDNKTEKKKGGLGGLFRRSNKGEDSVQQKPEARPKIQYKPESFLGRAKREAKQNNQFDEHLDPAMQKALLSSSGHGGKHHHDLELARAIALSKAEAEKSLHRSSRKLITDTDDSHARSKSTDHDRPHHHENHAHRSKSSDQVRERQPTEDGGDRKARVPAAKTSRRKDPPGSRGFDDDDETVICHEFSLDDEESLALALSLSLAEAKKSEGRGDSHDIENDTIEEGDDDEDEDRKLKAYSDGKDLSEMTEEEQIKFALRESLKEAHRNDEEDEKPSSSPPGTTFVASLNDDSSRNAPPKSPMSASSHSRSSRTLSDQIRLSGSGPSTPTQNGDSLRHSSHGERRPPLGKSPSAKHVSVPQSPKSPLSTSAHSRSTLNLESPRNSSHSRSSTPRSPDLGSLLLSGHRPRSLSPLTRSNFLHNSNRAVRTRSHSPKRDALSGSLHSRSSRLSHASDFLDESSHSRSSQQGHGLDDSGCSGASRSSNVTPKNSTSQDVLRNHNHRVPESPRSPILSKMSLTSGSGTNPPQSDGNPDALEVHKTLEADDLPGGQDTKTDGRRRQKRKAAASRRKLTSEEIAAKEDRMLQRALKASLNDNSASTPDQEDVEKKRSQIMEQNNSSHRSERSHSDRAHSRRMLVANKDDAKQSKSRRRPTEEEIAAKEEKMLQRALKASLKGQETSPSNHSAEEVFGDGQPQTNRSAARASLQRGGKLTELEIAAKEEEMLQQALKASMRDQEANDKKGIGGVSFKKSGQTRNIYMQKHLQRKEEKMLQDTVNASLADLCGGLQDGVDDVISLE